MDDKHKKKAFLTGHYFKNLLLDWKGVFAEPTTSDIQEVVEKIQAYEEINQVGKKFSLLLSFSDFRLLHIGKNVVDVFGYTADELMEYKAGVIFKLLPFAHLDFPVKALNWAKKVQAKTRLWLEHVNICFCGLKIKHKDGRIIRIFIRLQVLNNSEKGFPSMVLHTTEEVTHLVKGDHYWGRFVCGKNKQHSQSFLSKGEKREFSEIISEREKEVLLLIMDNKSSQEISEELGIATNTVIKHRKNMIMRTGAKDTTALMQLARMCELV